MNNVNISGRLIREPESIKFPSNSNLTTIFIANDVYFGENKRTGVFKVKAWGKLGNIVAEHCRTGTEIFVSGRLEQSSYKNENDTTVYDISLIMENFNFGNNKIQSDEEVDDLKEIKNK